MGNILLTLIVAFTIKIADKTLAPKYYQITYQDGQRETVVVGKNDYICPSYCTVNHSHSVSICDSDQCDHIEKSFIINKQKAENNTFNFSCKGKDIMLFEQIKIDETIKEKRKRNSIKLF